MSVPTYIRYAWKFYESVFSKKFQRMFQSHGNYFLLFNWQMKEQKNAPYRIGQESFGRFGSCVAAVGDLDSDGFHGTVRDLSLNIF